MLFLLDAHYILKIFLICVSMYTYGIMEVDFMARWQPLRFTPDKAADTMHTSVSLSAETISQSLNRTFLSSLFEQIFNSRSEALSLYNAINGTNYNVRHCMIMHCL